MYDIIQQIISHTWVSGSSSSGDQTYIYYMCGALIVIFSCVFIDLVYRVFSHFWKR